MNVHAIITPVGILCKACCYCSPQGLQRRSLYLLVSREYHCSRIPEAQQQEWNLSTSLVSLTSMIQLWCVSNRVLPSGHAESSGNSLHCLGAMIPTANYSKRGFYIHHGAFLFDNLWFLGEVLYPCYGLIPFVYVNVRVLGSFCSSRFSDGFFKCL